MVIDKIKLKKKKSKTKNNIQTENLFIVQKKGD